MVNRENLEAFLNPKSIAIQGVSGDLSKISGRPLKYLVNHKYKGKIFPVNPKYDNILGLRCYSNLKEIPDKIDLALIALPAIQIIDALKECVQQQIKSAIVFGSGFAEMGGEGAIRQKTLAEFANSNNILICGPNCQGMINLKDHVTASFTSALDRTPLLSGEIAFISQSGAYGGSIFNMAQESGIGFSYWVSTGNECDLTSLDLIDYLTDDPGTKVIAAYIEGFKEKDVNRNIDRITSITRKAAQKKKPIVMMKVGISEVGKKATASHTGSLAGSDSVFNAFCKQSGIIRVYDLEELFDVIYALSISRIPTGKRIGVITTSGGAGVSIADKASQLGLDIPTLREETRTELRNILPAFGSALNPVDVTGQISSRVIAKSQEAELYRKCVEIVAKDPEIDVLLIMLTMTGQDRAPKMANDIVHISKHTDKPVLVSWLAGDLAKEGYRILNENFIPTFKNPERCVAALKKLVEYAEIIDNAQQKKDTVTIAVQHAEELKSHLRTINKRTLTESDSRRILEAYGIPLARCIPAISLEEAMKAAEEIGFPVALKIDSPDILHKTDVGGVTLGIRDEAAFAASYRELINRVKHRASRADVKGVLVQEMIEGQAELMVGMSQDPQFGPTMMLGLGGIFVEIFKDISMRIAPISSTDAEAMVKEIKGYEILKGFRGRPRLDIASIIDILLRLSQLATDFRDHILEIDLNPVILLEEGKGVKVVDSLIVLQNGQEKN